jgi:hypothetical protein
LIRYPERDYTQLFDLEQDPLELNNLAENPAYQSKQKELTDLLKEWQQQSGDTAALTTKVIKPMAYDPDTLRRTPDR